MLFTKAFLANSRVAESQFKMVQQERLMQAANEENYRRIIGNAGLIPRDVYQEFDNVTVTRFRSDDGDTFLNDLLPLSRAINIGKLVHKFRQSSDAGIAQTSMAGTDAVKRDQTEFTYDGSIVPIHKTGFFRQWREWEAMSSEGFDALIDDQRECVATLRRHLADNFLDGHTDQQGNFIKVDGIDWQGMRNDSRVNQVDLGGGGLNFDFTDTTKTGAEIKAAWITMRDVLWITNNSEIDATYYVSREIASNFERKFSSQYDAKTIKQELADLEGVATIKTSSKLSGNEVMALPLDANKLRPIVGMGINTVALPRPLYNSNYEFDVWGAVGFEVRTDFLGNSGALFAQA